LIILVGGISTAMIAAPRIVEGQAVEEADDYRAVLNAMQQTLSGIQQTLFMATEPETTSIELFDLVAQLSRLDATSSALIDRASRPLPDTLPLLPKDPLEKLEPTRSQMLQLGSIGQLIVRRLADTISYRTRLDDILVYPTLPARADPNQISAVETQLANTLASSVEALSELPLDPAFDVHRSTASEAIQNYDDWRRRYLEILRESVDVDIKLIEEPEQLRAALFAQLIPALATMRAEVDTSIIELNNDTTNTLTAIP
tara:strand:- start:10 stop:783 length:774 start_codon:yes stop_codon:yes gene_type:complete